jgi:hypothetical protein
VPSCSSLGLTSADVTLEQFLASDWSGRPVFCTTDTLATLLSAPPTQTSTLLRKAHSVFTFPYRQTPSIADVMQFVSRGNRVEMREMDAETEWHISQEFVALCKSMTGVVARSSEANQQAAFIHGRQRSTGSFLAATARPSYGGSAVVRLCS